jgi:hypothetical protein
MQSNIYLDSNVHMKFSISLKIMLHVYYSCKLYIGMLLNGIVHCCQVPLLVGKYYNIYVFKGSPTHPLPRGNKKMKRTIQKKNIMKHCKTFLNQILLLRMKFLALQESPSDYKWVQYWKQLDLYWVLKSRVNKTLKKGKNNRGHCKSVMYHWEMGS